MIVDTCRFGLVLAPVDTGEEPSLRGSLVERGRSCGKPTCRCRQGHLRRSLYLAVRDHDQGEQVVEHYHQGVIRHLIGHALAVALDVELLRPGDGEEAAKRLLLRDANGLFAQRPPAAWRDRRLAVRYWDEEGFTTCEGVEQPRDTPPTDFRNC